MIRLPGRHRGARAGAASGLGRPAGPRTPWREARWCAVDLELTGLDPREHQIIAIGAVPVEGGRLLLGKSVYSLVRSDRRSEAAAMLKHKLRWVDLARAPALDEALELLREALWESIPVFHTAAIERAFLGRAFARAGLRLPDAADTEALGRWWLQERTGRAPARVSLARLAGELGVPAEASHHALGDAITTAAAFVSLASRLDAIRPQTVGTLLRSADRFRAGARLGPG
jgi:DNA polymerase-3 subunit epsilon